MRNLATKHLQSEQFFLENELKYSSAMCPKSAARQMCGSVPPACAAMVTSVMSPVRLEPPVAGCMCLACESSKIKCPKKAEVCTVKWWTLNKMYPYKFMQPKFDMESLLKIISKFIYTISLMYAHQRVPLVLMR